VLLGDVLELRHGPARDAMRAAEAPLRALGAALGSDREVVILAGNHDHELVAPWFERRGRDGPPAPLALESAVRFADDDPLARIARWLAPARVRAAYPGVWLRDDVYATHGHYADLHLTIPTIERVGAGVMARVVGLPLHGPQRAEDYEAALAPLYAWIHAVAQRINPDRGGHLHGGSVRGWRALTGPGPRSLRRRLTALAFPAAVAALNRARIGPLRPELSRTALRQAGLHGMGEVSGRLGVEAGVVIFGHTHRAGPLPGDAPGEWATPAGTRLINSGCWVEEPSFVGRDPGRSPYRVGFAVWVDDAGPPELVNLLDR
jgi:hypothetical protein